MGKGLKQLRRLAGFFRGESPSAICASLGKSRYWLNKWVKRFDRDDAWCYDLSSSTFKRPHRTSPEIEEMVKRIRLSLYNNNLFFGAQAIRWQMEDLAVTRLPSERTINRILARNDLTHRRIGRYEPKGGPIHAVLLQEAIKPMRRILWGHAFCEDRFDFTGRM